MRQAGNAMTANSHRKAVIVQLPFPSQSNPDPVLDAYYGVYGRLYSRITPEYKITPGDLWEAPLWVAHLDGALGRSDTTFIDLSRIPATAANCAAELLSSVDGPSYLLFSPLAQNFDLAVAVAQALRNSGHTTVLGGNMARLANPSDFDVVFIGQADSGLYDGLERRSSNIIGVNPLPGARGLSAGFRPRYRLLKDFGNRVPLVRLNASHGCLFACSFCGDGWSRQLHVVPYDDLAREFEEIEQTFPAIRWVYIGDKTFGQSDEAVENLIRVFASRRGRYHVVVQTHVSMISDRLLDVLDIIGARVVEMGFETADQNVLRALHKRGGASAYRSALEKLRERKRYTVLNLLGGLPMQTEGTQTYTLDFLRDSEDLVYLYNLYNFVPYPDTPLFPTLRPRICDWNYANWREDRPVVFQPYFLSRERSWELFLELVQTCTRFCEKRETALSRQHGLTYA
jgi:hypothetical protein